MKHEPRTWSLAEMPDLAGRTAVVTGPTSGLGTATARELARAGARVVLAGRSPEKLQATASDITAAVPGADLERLVVDLASLASVRTAAGAAARLGPIDLLVNNAGVMATRARRTEDGLDLQMATNHFGHFLLTGLLWPQLVAEGGGRVVSVSSFMHTRARSAPSTTRARHRAATPAGASTRRRSSPTCSSPTSCSAAPRPRALR
ncbi:SDR family NAD(P)-dependent oxidoreductase [Nocardioides zeae]